MSNDNEVKFRNKKRKKNSLGYLYLFAFVFAAALFFMSYLVKSYSPDVDVEIGNKENLTLSEEDMDVEIKNIDERLKWIQEEDEMPSVALRGEKKRKDIDNEDKIIDYTNEEFEKKEPVIPLPEKPKNSQADLKTAAASNTLNSNQVPAPKIPAPVPNITKVYLGSYETLEDAMHIQEKISIEIPDAMPFVKAVNNKYIVQLGSFSKREKADAFIIKLRSMGYNPHISEK